MAGWLAPQVPGSTPACAQDSATNRDWLHTTSRIHETDQTSSVISQLAQPDAQ